MNDRNLDNFLEKREKKITKHHRRFSMCQTPKSEETESNNQIN